MAEGRGVDSLRDSKAGFHRPGDNRMGPPLTPNECRAAAQRVLLDGLRYHLSRPRALTESRKSGLDGSADSLAKLSGSGRDEF